MKLRKRFIPPKRDHKFITINGRSYDGRIVIGNIFKLIAGEDIDLTNLLICCNSKNILIDWCEFVDDCFEDNRNPDRLLLRIEDALRDSKVPNPDDIIFGIKLFICERNS